MLISVLRDNHNFAALKYHIMQKLILFVIYFLMIEGAWGQSWVPTNILSNTRIDDLTFLDDSIGYCGQTNIIYKTKDQGKNWEIVGFNQDLQYIRSIDFLDTLTGFVGTLSFGTLVKPGLFMTKDGGNSFQKSLNIGNNEGICGISHINNTVIAVGTFAGPAKLYKSVDRGETFNTINLSQYLSGAVDCHIVDENIIFIAGNSTSSTGRKPVIIKSIDGGSTWSESLFFNSIGAGYIWKMHFGQNNTIHASVEIVNAIANKADNVMFVSKDLGTTWDKHTIDNTNIINYGGIAILPSGKGWLGDQHDNIFYETKDGGQTWTKSDNFVPSCNRIHTFSNGAAVATGSTIFYYGGTTTATIETPTFKNLQFEINCAPNPVGEQLNITLRAESPTFGVVEIYDLNGKLILVDHEKGFDQGDNTLQVNVSNYQKGTYIVVWKTSHKMVSKKFTKL